ncbi:MAG TPA: MBL fold metallo-hydrolase [Spirochaetota bacterium]|nr:MBL fold metallo-hydrolase [Spirochaetota bacterium]
MKITIWGARGSIPTPGPSTVKYGGNTTCVEVSLQDGTMIILDAGSGIRNLGKKIIEERKTNDIYLILTHSHWDHLIGFPFFKPAYSNNYAIHIRGGPIAKETVRNYLEHQMEPPYFPARFSAMKAKFDFTHGIPIVKQIGSATVTPIPLSHPNGGYGYRIKDGEKTFVFLTDNELEHHHEGGKSLADYIRFCEGADLLLHDAQYTDREYRSVEGFGHSTVSISLELGIRARVKRFGLFHHDPDHTDAEIDGIVGEIKRLLQQKKATLNFFAASEGRELIL